MRIKMTALGPVEMVGEITDLREVGDWLVMRVRMTTPVGWEARAELTHKDLMTLVKLLLRPSNLRYFFFGFGKPRSNKPLMGNED